MIFFSTSVTRMSAVSAPYLVYSATKGAIEQLSRVLAKDLGARGITVNTVSPGPVNTPLFHEGKPPQVVEMIKNLAPLKRLGEPEDIAPLVSFLASEEARWVNGQNIMANGVCDSLLMVGDGIADNFCRASWCRPDTALLVSLYNKSIETIASTHLCLQANKAT